MNSLFKSSFLLLTASFSVAALQAQVAETKPEKTNAQNIIIHKKDSTKEKITVVIDGNTVTVNGKPVEDFKSKDVDVISHSSGENRVFVYKNGSGAGTAMAPIPPTPPMHTFSADMARTVKTNSAFLGVMTDKTEQGAKITEVTEGSAAEKAGLKEEDIITKVGEDKVTGPEDLYKAVGKHKPEEKVAITYLRGGKQATASAILGKSEQVKVYSWNAPNEFNEDFSRNFNRNYSFSWSEKPRLGISVQDTEEGNGVKILEIDDEESPAAKAGLEEDDIITQVNGKAINSTDDLRQNTKDLKKGDTVKITYKRDGLTKTVDVKIPKELKTIDL